MSSQCRLRLSVSSSSATRVSWQKSLTWLLVVGGHLVLLCTLNTTWRTDAQPASGATRRMTVVLLPPERPPRIREARPLGAPAIGTSPGVGGALQSQRSAKAAGKARTGTADTPWRPADAAPQARPVEPRALSDTPPGKPTSSPQGEAAGSLPLLLWRAGERLAVAPTLAERTQRSLGHALADNSFGAGVARSSRPDCRHAYSKLGLLAIPRLIVDAVRDEGCNW